MKRNFGCLLVISLVVLVFGTDTRARMVFLDRFEYAAGRNDTNAPQIFVQNGWSTAKTQQTEPGAHGYFHTVTSIPGYNGPMPGTNSTRVLAIEALPATLRVPGSPFAQTDFYLQYGNGSSSAYDDTIPGDVWFQFWLYPQNYGNQLSQYSTRNKFMYVCNTDYPCHSHLWMVTSGSPFGPNAVNPFPFGDPSQGNFYFLLRNNAGVSQINNTTGDPYATDAVGSTNNSNPTEWMRPNRWTLVKMHMRTTATSGNAFEMWLRPLGGQWVKVSEWIGGVTPGFSWNVPAEHVGGHRVFRMPTTVSDHDYYMYMDDFAIATTEQDLPTYGGGSGTLTAPTNLRIIGDALLDGSLFFSPGSVLKRLSFGGESARNGND